MASLLSTACLLVITIISKSEGVIKPQGKAVLITGCDSGLGHEAAKQFNQMGFKVFAAVLDPQCPGALDLKNNVTFADKMVVLKLDITKDSDVNEAFEKVKQDLTSTGCALWGLINAAYITSYFPLEWGTLECFRKMFEVNVFGAVRMSRVFMPLLRASKGRLTNLVGLLGRVTLRGMGAYSMTKHALLSFTDVLRQEINRFGIKVASIESGISKTGTFKAEELIKKLEKTWSETSNDVKAAYMDISKEKQQIKTIFTAKPSEDSLGIVVDDIIDSIVNEKPKANYRRLDVLNRLFYIINYCLPTEISDFIMQLLFKMGPMLAVLK